MLELPPLELALPEDLGVLGIELEATQAIQSLRGAVIHLQTPPGQSHGYLLAELKLERGQPGPPHCSQGQWAWTPFCPPT